MVITISLVHVYCLIFEEGNGSPLQYSCLENSMDRGAWKATVHGVAKSWTRLSDCHSLIISYWYNIKEIEKTFIVITLRISSSSSFFFLLMHNCFTMFCFWCTMKRISYMYTYVPLFMGLSPCPIHLGHHRAMSWAPCTI